jgi:G3E family GTPase
MLKTKIELVTGFIGAGKTAWINTLLEETYVYNEKIVILQLEKGEDELDPRLKQKTGAVYLMAIEKDLTQSYLSHLLLLYEPDRLIIECNGIKALDEILGLLSDPKVRKRAIISTIFNVAEAPAFKMYWNNLRPILMPALALSNMILVTKTHLISEQEKEEIRAVLEKENTHGHIVFLEDLVDMQITMGESPLLDKGWTKVLRVRIAGQLKALRRGIKS